MARSPLRGPLATRWKTKLGVVEGEEAAALDAEMAAEESENLIQSMNGKDFANAGVVVPDGALRIAAGGVIAHAGFGATDEGGVAEDDPRLFSVGHKGLPKRLEGLRRRLVNAGVRGGDGLPAGQQHADGDDRDDEQHGENGRSGDPE